MNATLPSHNKRGTGTPPPADMADAIAQAVYLPPAEGLAKDAPPRGDGSSPTPNRPECQTARAAMDLIEGLTATMIMPDEAARWRALAAEMEARLSAAPADSQPFIDKVKSRKLIVAVAGVPISWVAAKLGIDPEVIITGVWLLAAYVVGQAAVDTAKAKPPATR